MHGRQECAGNVQQLCVNKYAPASNWWEFVKCQNYQGRENVGLPEVVFKCAKTADVDLLAGGAGRCIGLDGSGTAAEGVALLRESARFGHQLGISCVFLYYSMRLWNSNRYHRKSCTVLISGRKVCVHDGNWKDCEVRLHS